MSKIELLKEGEIGKTFQADGFKILYRNKGSVSGNNEINPKESVFFITGKAKVTVKEKTWEIEAPAHVDFPAKTFHAIEALTDISFVIFEN